MDKILYAEGVGKDERTRTHWDTVSFDHEPLRVLPDKYTSPDPCPRGLCPHVSF